MTGPDESERTSLAQQIRQGLPLLAKESWKQEKLITQLFWSDEPMTGQYTYAPEGRRLTAGFAMLEDDELDDPKEYP